ncbi:cation diffusion facilitator family transporter [Aneurinibacillus sp. Ricciae_BoGa-3]|uniref:cation diffusion facilitator family transporter n=1 Tax=Aneurinibacillus sp. Ricciae_BoGa-3 TaxID=3022697 RepID=UPI0023411501|nr:cation diffusion facilitator family transporter [Aneurinibacillus sp. Ricciae_BoGa-3]WCK53282.1 cation diffusion facilitator family transporter [Aneurinibacillus sp. Ricciae_BoGa-3]
MKKEKMSSSVFAVWISLVSNMFLTGIKIVVGFLFSSEVLIADGFHNAGDVIATFAALISTTVARKPSDSQHPYGHGKAEIIGSAIVAVIMAIAAIFIAYHSVESFFKPAVEASYFALVAALISLIWKQILYVYCMRIGKSDNNKSLIATANDHLADVYASIAATVGIGLTIVGDQFGISFLRFGDPLAGIIVSFFVFKLSYEMGREAIDVLMEKTVSPERLDKFAELTLAVPGVKRIDRIRAREHGYYVIVDVRVGIPGQYSVQQGHDVSRNIKKTIMDHNDDVQEVLVHINPWYEA